MTETPRLGAARSAAAVQDAATDLNRPLPTPEDPWTGSHRYQWRRREIVEITIMALLGAASIAGLLSGVNSVLPWFGVIFAPMTLLAIALNVRRKRRSLRRLSFDGSVLVVRNRAGGIQAELPLADIARVASDETVVPTTLDYQLKRQRDRSAVRGGVFVAIPVRVAHVDWVAGLLTHVHRDVAMSRSARAAFDSFNTADKEGGRSS